MSKSESIRSTSIQLLLFSLAIIVSGIVVLNYPQPEPPPPDPFPENFIFINATMASSGPDGKTVFTPIPNLDLVFYAWGQRGPLSEIDTSVQTNSSGVAEVRLDTGMFDVQITDQNSVPFARETIVVTQNSTLTVDRVLVNERPSTIKILSLSSNWDVSSFDLIEATFKNSQEKTVFLQSVTLAGKELVSSICEGLSAGEIEFQEEYGAMAEEECEVAGEIPALEEWSDIFRVPFDVSIPWRTARESIDITLNFAFTEVTLDP